MKDFAGKVAFITGGASGAGFGQAKVFSEAGCKVVIADIRQDHLDEAMAYFRQKKADVHSIKLDITDRKAYEAVADEVERVYGTPPQLLFNTAGVNTFGPPETSTFEDYDWVMSVCLGGVINGMVIFVPRMIKAGKGGHIVTTSSMGGFMAASGCTPYSAAKAAVNSLMECYFQALKPYNIGVTCLCPGGINTNIHEATLTRPAHLKNTGYNVDEKTLAAERRIYAVGIDPVELALILKKGIENDQLFVLPVPDPEKTLKETLERIVNYSTPEGMKRQEELSKKRMEEMRSRMGANNPFVAAAESGWGKARKDITWVKESSRLQSTDKK
ncbi:MAG TPA: SDR family NAD(P)-dependent oxidoreductase [Dehalococcoidales bacterium]|nr:SDR family NAD(P)-dependent oxidoreductase [Dehalococcoidales bacterium]